MQLKKLHKEAVTKALAKAERYRYLNDPSAAESICRDILDIEPSNESALITLILSLTDQFVDPTHHMNIKQPLALLDRLKSEYQKTYYHGIICERWAKAQLHRGSIGSGPMAYGLLREAMEWYQKAESIHEDGNDEAILRWNSCVRFIEAHKLSAASSDDQEFVWYD